MDFIADQLVGLFDAHVCSGIYFTADQLVGLLGAHHQPVGHIARHYGFIDGYAEDMPPMLGTPRRLDSSCKSRQLSLGLPWRLDFATSHRCAFKLLHAVQIRVLIFAARSGS